MITQIFPSMLGSPAVSFSAVALWGAALNLTNPNFGRLSFVLGTLTWPRTWSSRGKDESPKVQIYYPLSGNESVRCFLIRCKCRSLLFFRGTGLCES